jgi:hypothetical protein
VGVLAFTGMRVVGDSVQRTFSGDGRSASPALLLRRRPSRDPGEVTTPRPPHDHVARHFEIAHQVVGGDPRHLFIGLAPSLAAVEGQSKGERLAHVVRIGGAEWIVWHGRRVVGERKRNKRLSICNPSVTRLYASEDPRPLKRHSRVPFRRRPRELCDTNSSTRPGSRTSHGGMT